MYNQSDIGKVRSTVLLKKLETLNPFVNVEIIEQVETHICENVTVLLVNQNYNTAVTINKLTRQKDANFLMVQSYGLSGCVFSDPENFTSNDATGENIVFQIKSTKKEGCLIVNTLDKHNLSVNDLIKFTNVTGQNISNLSENQYVKKLIDPYNFEMQINNLPENFSFSNGSGIKIMSKDFKFESLENQLTNPSLEMNLMNPDMPQLLFDAYLKINQGLIKISEPWSDELISLSDDKLFHFIIV